MRTLLTLLMAWGGLASADSGIAKQAMSDSSQGNAVLLDVRENDEVALGRVRGAITFPLSKMGSAQWDHFVASLNKEKIIYTYCARGRRAEIVAKELRKRGFRAQNAGGLNDLKKFDALTQ